MGWHANTSWDLTFRPGHTLNELAADLLASDNFWDTQWSVRPEASEHEEIVERVLVQFGEDGEFEVDGASVKGWTGGKANDIGPDENTTTSASGFVWNRGGLGVYRIFAKHMDGTVDWDSNEDGPSQWRIRLLDGEWNQYEGVMTYPGDPVEEKTDGE